MTVTELDFVRTTQLARVRVLRSLLTGLYPSDDGPITSAELREVARVVDEWVERLERAVKTRAPRNRRG